MPNHPSDLPLFSRAEVARMLGLPYQRVVRAVLKRRQNWRALSLQNVYDMEMHGDNLEGQGTWELDGHRPVAYRPLPGVVVRPGVGWGRFCLEGTGINTSVVASRIRGGESIQEVADDFGVNEALVRAAVEFEGC